MGCYPVPPCAASLLCISAFAPCLAGSMDWGVLYPMRLSRLLFWFVVITAVVSLGLPAASTAPAEGMPGLEKSRAATRLMVDGQPRVLIAGELHNSSSSSLTYMQPIWPKLAALNLNSVIASLSWELVEPEEGKFDFRLLDGLIEGARRHHLGLVFIWCKGPGRLM